MKIEIISTDGVYLINDRHRDARSVVMASGLFGAATAKLVYKTSTGDTVDYLDAGLYSGKQVILAHGLGAEVHVKVEGASPETLIEVRCASVD